MAASDNKIADTDEKIFIGKGERSAWLTLALAGGTLGKSMGGSIGGSVGRALVRGADCCDDENFRSLAFDVT
jgi:hypothetical protein